MTDTHESADFRAGFVTLDHETSIEELPLTGTLPPWLTGTLVRNGPAEFDGGRRAFRHWFDGQAMLHRFALGDGKVGYTNKYLDTPSLRSVREKGRIGFLEFATDPCASLFGRFFSAFRIGPGTTNNAINVVQFEDESLALGEVPVRVWFDEQTLATVGVDDYDDSLDGTLTTAHPHRDPATGDLINFVLKFGRRSEYRIYRQHGARGERRLVGTVPVDKPGYVHSFGVTEHYAVLAVFPLVVNPLSFLLRNRPFIENYSWKPDLGTTFHVVDLRSGELVASLRDEACFAFHHINAQQRDGQLLVDLSTFEDDSIIGALYLDALREDRGVPLSTPTRFTLDLDTGSVTRSVLSEVSLELPRIDYRRNGQAYRYVYGVGSQGERGDDFLNQLVRLDVETGETQTWSQPGCYPSEPVFVPRPGADDEDDGVVLTVVLDAQRGHSLLVVLDAATFTEIASAQVPHAVPFGLHGQYRTAR